jgi:hypothetical protein
VGPLDFLTAPLRSVLGRAEQAEREVVAHSPVGETRELERRLADAVAAVHTAAKSIDRQVEAFESLASSLTPLTESVTKLTDQLGELLHLTAPLEAVERDVSRVERLFGRGRRPAEPPPTAGGEAPQDS